MTDTVLQVGTWCLHAEVIRLCIRSSAAHIYLKPMRAVAKVVWTRARAYIFQLHFIYYCNTLSLLCEMINVVQNVFNSIFYERYLREALLYTHKIRNLHHTNVQQQIISSLQHSSQQSIFCSIHSLIEKLDRKMYLHAWSPDLALLLAKSRHDPVESQSRCRKYKHAFFGVKVNIRLKGAPFWNLQ